MTDQQKLQALNSACMALQNTMMQNTDNNREMMNIAFTNIRAVMKVLQDDMQAKVNKETIDKTDENKN